MRISRNSLIFRYAKVVETHDFIIRSGPELIMAVVGATLYYGLLASGILFTFGLLFGEA